MKASLSLLTVFELLSLVSAAQRWDNGTVWTTEIVTAYTTYCPSPTTIVQNNQTYSVTSATLLTITNCPCTISTMVPAGPAPTTTTVGGGVGATTSGAASSTTSGAASSTASGVVQSSNAGAVAGSCFGAIIAFGIMAGLL